MVRTQLADPRSVRRAGVARKMNKAEAQQLTAQIRATAHGLWRLVAEAYDRQAWKALGFESWKDYATEELQMSESRSYQLIDTGRVMKAIGEVAGTEDVFETVVVTARETAKIKPHMSTFKKEVQEYIKDGMEPAEAVEMAIQALPVMEKRPSIRRQPDMVIEGTVVEAKTTEEPEPLILSGTVPAPSPARVVPAPLFSGPAEPDQTFSRPKPPRGKKVCPTCEGHGYV